MIKVKRFSKFTEFIIRFIGLFVLIIGLGFIFSTALFNSKDDKLKLIFIGVGMGILVLDCFLLIIITKNTRLKILYKVEKIMEEGMYKDALSYLEVVSRKKRLSSTNQFILAYSGKCELYLGNTKTAIEYFEQYDLEEKLYENYLANCYVVEILYMYYYENNDMDKCSYYIKKYLESKVVMERQNKNAVGNVKHAKKYQFMSRRISKNINREEEYIYKLQGLKKELDLICENNIEQARELFFEREGKKIPYFCKGKVNF